MTTRASAHCLTISARPESLGWRARWRVRNLPRHDLKCVGVRNLARHNDWPARWGVRNLARHDDWPARWGIRNLARHHLTYVLMRSSSIWASMRNRIERAAGTCRSVSIPKGARIG